MKDKESKDKSRDVFISYASDKGDSTGSRDRAAAVGSTTPGSFVVPVAASSGPPLATATLASACARIVENRWSNACLCVLLFRTQTGSDRSFYRFFLIIGNILFFLIKSHTD
jgi:hypothetical protein